MLFLHRMEGIKFPVIADRNGDLSRNFGVLNLDTNLSSRALAILNHEFKLVHLTFNNEQTVSSPNQVLELVKKFQQLYMVSRQCQ